MNTDLSPMRSISSALNPKKEVSPVQTATREKATAGNVGRPISGKLTPEVLAAICDAHSAGTALRVACNSNHVSLTAVYSHLNREPEFKRTMFDPARALFMSHLEERAWDLALQADTSRPTMLIFMLKSYKPDVYRDRVEHTGKNGQDINRVMDPEARKKLTDEILAKIPKKLDDDGLIEWCGDVYELRNRKSS